MTFVFPNDIYTCTCNLLASSFLGLFWIANGTMHAYYHLNIFNRNGRKCTVGISKPKHYMKKVGMVLTSEVFP